MEKIISGDKRRKRKKIKGKLLSNQIATRKKKKMGKLSLHENWTRVLVLRISVRFSRHIALVCRAPKSYSLTP